MTLVFGIFFFALGAIIASFIGVVVERLNTGGSFVRGRSQCDACGVTLGGIDLVPVLSYVVHRGRCNTCASPISPSSTIAELLLGALYLGAYLKLGLSVEFALFLIVLATLLALVLYDLRHMIIPPVFLVILVIASALYGLGAYADFLVPTVLTALGIGAFFALLHFLSAGRAMGLADAPLAFALALATGPLALSGLFYSFWIGAAYGIVVLLRSPAGHRMGQEVPFAPFLAAGFLLAYFTQWNLFLLIGALPY